MITSLRLKNFKNFQDAELKLGHLTTLVGTNAAGKSNLRDAFRFLHGIARGYSIAEIIGTKYGEGGELQWRGIRGGVREIAYSNQEDFEIEVSIQMRSAYKYKIAVNVGEEGTLATVSEEALYIDGVMAYDSNPDVRLSKPHQRYRKGNIEVCYEWHENAGGGGGKLGTFSNYKPVLSQIASSFLPARKDISVHKLSEEVLSSLNSIRFLDLNPDAMRQPSFPGQDVIGDRGENLSSVLQAICRSETGKETLLSWLQELTPMDAADFEFPTDQIGRVLATLVEENGQKISAYSASDGTLRFLAMIAALLGPESAKFYFFEELDNGIHPTRLHLLLQLIEQQVEKGQIQMVASTHSPQLLRLLSRRSLESASLVYRLPDSPSARITRLLDLPDAERLVREQDVATLLESGWLEDAVAFQNAEQETEEIAA